MKLIDLHCDTLSKLAKPWHRGDLRENPYAVDLRRLEEADALIQCFSTYFYSGGIPRAVREAASYRIAERRIDLFEKQKKKCGGRLLHIKSSEDILRCEKEGKVGALLTLEDAVPVGNSLEKLQHFYRRGIRLITLTWNFENAAGFPNSEDARVMQKGLKPFGFELIEEMNRLGMVADVSHLSDGGFWDVARCCRQPFIASHSNARAVTPHPRNLTDEMIRAVADRGGVIGLNFYFKFLGGENVSKVSAMVRHIHHIYRTGGEDVLAIGTDFDGISGKLQISGTQEMYRLSDALKKCGMSERMLEKLWYKNARRVLLEVL